MCEVSTHIIFNSTIHKYTISLPYSIKLIAGFLPKVAISDKSISDFFTHFVIFVSKL